jgi:hypothetical protein
VLQKALQFLAGLCIRGLIVRVLILIVFWICWDTQEVTQLLKIVIHGIIDFVSSLCSDVDAAQEKHWVRHRHCP